MLGASAASALAQRATVADALKAAVLRADEARLYTMTTAQAAALADLLTDDCLYIHSSGRAQSKAEFVGSIESGQLRYWSMRYEQPPQVRLFGSETAVVNGTAQSEVESRSTGRISLRIVVTSVYVAEGGRWKLASYHSCVAPK